MRILLIEDEDFIRDLYKRQFDHSQMPIDAFGLGNDGLAALSKNQYDIILLDIMLPDTNGLQVLKSIKQNQATKNIPVILLTNLSQDMIIKEGFELGAEGYLVKAAYTPDQIVQEVKNMLARKQAGQPIATPAQTALPEENNTPTASTGAQNIELELTMPVNSVQSTNPAVNTAPQQTAQPQPQQPADQTTTPAPQPSSEPQK